jgi:hypothetical protein
MTRRELWAAYCRHNPEFSPGEPGATVTMSVAGLRKLFDQTWDKAEAHGRAEAQQSIRDKTHADSLFGRIFG